MDLVVNFYERSADALSKGADIKDIIDLPVREAIGRFKYVKEEDIDAEYEKVDSRLNSELADALSKEEDY